MKLRITATRPDYARDVQEYAHFLAGRGKSLQTEIYRCRSIHSSFPMPIVQIARAEAVLVMFMGYNIMADIAKEIV